MTLSLRAHNEAFALRQEQRFSFRTILCPYWQAFFKSAPTQGRQFCHGCGYLLAVRPSLMVNSGSPEFRRSHGESTNPLWMSTEYLKSGRPDLPHQKGCGSCPKVLSKLLDSRNEIRSKTNKGPRNSSRGTITVLVYRDSGATKLKKQLRHQ